MMEGLDKDTNRKAELYAALRFFVIAIIPGIVCYALMVYLNKSGSKLLMLNTSMYGSYAVWYEIVEAIYKKFVLKQKIPGAEKPFLCVLIVVCLLQQAFWNMDWYNVLFAFAVTIAFTLLINKQKISTWWFANRFSKMSRVKQCLVLFLVATLLLIWSRKFYLIFIESFGLAMMLDYCTHNNEDCNEAC